MLPHILRREMWNSKWTKPEEQSDECGVEERLEVRFPNTFGIVAIRADENI